MVCFKMIPKMQRKYSSMYGCLLFFICSLLITDADMGCNNTDLDRCECSNGRYGEECEMQCSQNCWSENGTVRCSKHTGICSYGCKHGWCYGNCTTQCSKNCRNRTCLTYNCQCDGCENGYYGDHCDKPCGKNCSRCDQGSGYCICEVPSGSRTEVKPGVRQFGCGWLSCGFTSVIIFAFVRLLILDYIWTRRSRKSRGNGGEGANTQEPRQPETHELRQPETQELSQPETQELSQPETQELNQQETQGHAQRSLCKKHWIEHWVFYFVMIITGVIGVILVSCGYRS